jgi:monofunctional biosynthetic peptidoglycan transglycosylase
MESESASRNGPAFTRSFVLHAPDGSEIRPCHASRQRSRKAWQNFRWRAGDPVTDWRAMKTRSAIAAILFTCLPAVAGERVPVAEFSPGESEKLDWRIVDDGVMGGLSQGKREITKDGILRFFGTLSLENNGGFSSLRTEPVKLDLSGAEGLMLRVKGDGRTYQLRLSTDAQYRGREMSFQAGFPTEKNKWTEVKVPFARLVGTWRGMELPDKTFDPAMIRRLGLILADKQQGPFELRVDWIRTYGGDDV